MSETIEELVYENDRLKDQNAGLRRQIDSLVEELSSDHSAVVGIDTALSALPDPAKGTVHEEVVVAEHVEPSVTMFHEIGTRRLDAPKVVPFKLRMVAANHNHNTLACWERSGWVFFRTVSMDIFMDRILEDTRRHLILGLPSPLQKLVIRETTK
jgi:hypothetical protein